MHSRMVELTTAAGETFRRERSSCWKAAPSASSSPAPPPPAGVSEGEKASSSSSSVGMAVGFQDLPQPIVLEILSWLPAATLVQVCRYVCKSWYGVTKEPFFTQLQLERALEKSDPPSSYLFACNPLVLPFWHPSRDRAEACLLEVTAGSSTTDRPPCRLDEVVCLRGCHVRATCHGLICFCRNECEDNPIFLWNLVTGEAAVVPMGLQIPNVVGRSVVDFAYDPAAKEYKLLQLGSRPIYPSTVTPPPPPYSRAVQVYTLGDESWRQIADCPFKMVGSSVTYNGALYWITVKFRELVRFDIGSEKFGARPLPRKLRRSARKCTGETALHSLRDGLSIVENHWRTLSLKIWVPQDEASNTWTKSYSLTLQRLCAQQPHFNFGLRGLWVGGELLVYTREVLVAVDPQLRKMRIVGFDLGRNIDFAHAFAHVGSLISPKTLLQRQKKKKQGVVVHRS